MGGATLERHRPDKLDLDKMQTESRTEDLGTQVIEGVNAQGSPHYPDYFRRRNRE